MCQMRAHVSIVSCARASYVSDVNGKFVTDREMKRACLFILLKSSEVDIIH